MHEWPVCDMTNPDLQRHWKDPCTFKHFPFAHMPFFSHSLWSKNDHLSINVKPKRIYTEMHTYTTFSVRGQIVAWWTRAYKTSRRIVTLAVIADPLLSAFVDVCGVEMKQKQKNKWKFRWKFKTISDDMRVCADTSVLFTHKMTSLHTLVTPRVCSLWNLQNIRMRTRQPCRYICLRSRKSLVLNRTRPPSSAPFDWLCRRDRV